MVCFFLFVLLIFSMPIYRSQLKVAAFLDVLVVLLLCTFRVVPGTAHLVEWMFMLLFLIDSAAFLFVGKEVLI